MGTADRVVAGTNGALIVLNMTMDGIPVVGRSRWPPPACTWQGVHDTFVGVLGKSWLVR